MKISNKISMVLAAGLALACSKNDTLFENKAFIDATSFRTEVRVATDEGVKTLSRSLTVGIAQRADHDITVRLKKDENLLETYRQAYYHEDALLLPAENCDLSGLQSLIKKGDIATMPIELSFTNLDKLDYTKEYVLPVSIQTEGIGTLERSKTMYYVVKEASLVNVAADMYKNRAWPVWDNWEKVADLSQFTMECLINMHAFNNPSSINTIMGIEDNFLIRVGDATIPTNQIQVACAYKDQEGATHRKNVTDAALQLKKDRWYHVAVTFDSGVIKVYLDGKLRKTEDLSADYSSADLSAPHSEEDDGKPRCFWIGYSYDKDRSLNGMISEARIWDKALTAAEINAPNHFYKLQASEITDRLLAYWKFDDGKGKTVTDHSVYGHNLEANNDFLWYPVSLPAKN